MSRTTLLVVCLVGAGACHGEPAGMAPAAAPPPKAAGKGAPPQDMPAPADPFAFDPSLFARKRKPGPHDWLASFPEPGQTFAEYVAQAPKGLTGKRNVIVLQPIGRFTKDEAAVLEQLRAFTSAFFQLRARVEKAIPLPDHGKRSRTQGSLAWTQYHTGTVMRDVLLPRLPEDAVCYLGITMSDLYPDPAWNFVFGQASLDQRVGVYSLVRYTNRFWGEAETEKSRRMFLLRSFKVLAHETGHMFSIHHCAANECLMNGSNSLEETDRSTIHLCPVCLHKLQWNLKFDLPRRYRQLRDIYTRSGYEEPARWIDRRLARLWPALAAIPATAP